MYAQIGARAYFTRATATRRALGTWKKAVVDAGLKGVLMAVGGIGTLAALGYVLRTHIHQGAAQQSAEIVTKTLAHDQVVENAHRFTKEITAQVLNDEQTVVLVVGLLQRVLAQDATRKAVVDLLGHVFAQEQTRRLTTDFLVSLLQQREVQRQLDAVALRTVEDLLANPKSRDLLVGLLRDVVAQESLQKSAGDALWRAYAYSVTPSYFLRS